MCLAHEISYIVSKYPIFYMHTENGITSDTVGGVACTVLARLLDSQSNALIDLLQRQCRWAAFIIIAGSIEAIESAI